MKKFLSAFILMLVPVLASAYHEITGICYTFDEYSKTAQVTYYPNYNSLKKYSGNIVIPAFVYNDIITVR